MQAIRYDDGMTIVSRMLERSYLPKAESAATPRHLPAESMRLAARIRRLGTSVLGRIVPWGYEDESGFHYGSPSLLRK